MTDMTNPKATAVKNDSGPDTNDRHSLRSYVSDLVALMKHIDVPIERQRTAADTADYADANAIVNDIKSIVTAQHAALERQLEALGGHPATGIKSAWSSLLGAGAAALGSVRTTKVSKNLRDDYTALSLASISYTMLHATALGLGNQSVAALAAQHLAQITPLIVRISKVIPLVVLRELRDDGENVSLSAAEMSAQTTQAAWQQNVN